MLKIDEKYYSYFEEAGITYNIKKDGILYMQGELSPNVYLIKSGRLRMYYIGENEKEITFQILGTGQLIGESAFLSHSRPTTISAITDVTLISCSVKRLFPYMQKYEALNAVMLELLTDNYQYLCNQLRRLTMYNSHQKVASYLLDHTRHSEQSLGVYDHTLPYTHDELSVCLNLNRVTVTKILNQFAKAGLIELGYKKIHVIDAEGLGKIYDSYKH